MTYRVAYSAHFTRAQLVARILAFCALGVFGVSLGAIFAFGYLALPVFAAIRLGSIDPAVYRTDGTRIVRGVHWLAAIGAWIGLVTDRLPSHAPDEAVQLGVTVTAKPTPGSALWRVLTGLPSAIALALLGCIGIIVWLWSALSVLFFQEVGPHAFHYLVGLQRWSIRLLAYQASLVDEYPPFSFADSTESDVPTARTAAH